MARDANQIVKEQLGHLTLELVLAQARNEDLQEQIAKFTAQVSMLEAAAGPKGESEHLRAVDEPENEEMKA